MEQSISPSNRFPCFRNWARRCHQRLRQSLDGCCANLMKPLAGIASHQAKYIRKCPQASKVVLCIRRILMLCSNRHWFFAPRTTDNVFAQEISAGSPSMRGKIPTHLALSLVLRRSTVELRDNDIPAPFLNEHIEDAGLKRSPLVRRACRSL